MSNKAIVMLTMSVGSVAGGYIPSLWGADMFSLWGAFGAFFGGLAGVWIGWRLIQ